MTEEIQKIYSRRWAGLEEYRKKVWRILVDRFFHKWAGGRETVLDLGAGYGEFINAVKAPHRYALDLNPETETKLHPDVIFYCQASSLRWPLPDNSLDLVFSSNFFEHLPDKPTLLETLKEAERCLRKGGRLVTVGPNIKFLHGAYWNFWDHQIPLSDDSLAEALRLAGFEIELQIPRFLPYTMSKKEAVKPPLWCLKVYLKLRFLWRIAGKQFLLIAVKR